MDECFIKDDDAPQSVMNSDDWNGNEEEENRLSDSDRESDSEDAFDDSEEEWNDEQSTPETTGSSLQPDDMIEHVLEEDNDSDIPNEVLSDHEEDNTSQSDSHNNSSHQPDVLSSSDSSHDENGDPSDIEDTGESEDPSDSSSSVQPREEILDPVPLNESNDIGLMIEHRHTTSSDDGQSNSELQDRDSLSSVHTTIEKESEGREDLMVEIPDVIETLPIEEHRDEGSEKDSLEEIVQKERERYLEERSKREAAVHAIRQSKSAPAGSLSLSSPDTAAQRRRNQELQERLPTPDLETKRVEYAPRDSSTHVPQLHIHEMKQDNDLMDAKCASDEMDAFSKCKESCSLSSDGKEIETDSECCPWGNDSIDRRTTPRLDELFPTRKASVKHLEMLDMKKQSKNGKVSKANSKPIVHSSKSKETPKRTVSKIKPAEGAKSKALKKQKEIFPQISARTIPLSASIGYKSERKPIKKEWNFDTKITRDAKPKRRPMSALEINRKVQVLIKRTALEKENNRRPKTAIYHPLPTLGNSTARSSYLRPILSKPGSKTHSGFKTLVLNKNGKPSQGTIYAGTALKSISEANRMSEQLGGRFRYRLESKTVICSDVFVDVFDCVSGTWLEKPFSYSKFMKKHQLLQTKLQETSRSSNRTSKPSPSLRHQQNDDAIQRIQAWLDA